MDFSNIPQPLIHYLGGKRTPMQQVSTNVLRPQYPVPVFQKPPVLLTIRRHIGLPFEIRIPSQEIRSLE